MLKDLQEVLDYQGKSIYKDPDKVIDRANKYLKSLFFREYYKVLKKAKKVRCVNCTNFTRGSCSLNQQVGPCDSFHCRAYDKKALKLELKRRVNDEYTCNEKYPKIYALKKVLGHFEPYPLIITHISRLFFRFWACILFFIFNFFIGVSIIG